MDGRREMIEHLLVTYLDKKIEEYNYIVKNIKDIEEVDLLNLVDFMTMGKELNGLLHKIHNKLTRG
jgi:hypothetical protein